MRALISMRSCRANLRIGESLPEWEIPMRIAERARPALAHLIHFEDGQSIRDEIASDNFLNLFFFTYLLENTRLDKSTVNTTNQVLAIGFCSRQLKVMK